MNASANTTRNARRTSPPGIYAFIFVSVAGFIGFVTMLAAVTVA